jgi:hypothetical protein
MNFRLYVYYIALQKFDFYSIGIMFFLKKVLTICKVFFLESGEPKL